MPPLAGVEFTGLAGRSRPTATNLMLRKVRAGGVEDTTRFDALSSVIGFWVRRAREGGLTIGEAWLEVAGYNAAAMQPPWPEDRLRREFKAIVARDRRRTSHPQDDDRPSRRRHPERGRARGRLQPNGTPRAGGTFRRGAGGSNGRARSGGSTQAGGRWSLPGRSAGRPPSARRNRTRGGFRATGRSVRSSAWRAAIPGTWRSRRTGTRIGCVSTRRAE